MLTKIVEKLKTGSLKTVVPFGSKLPNPPYIVVKPETVPGRGRRFRIIIHYKKGQQSQLEDTLRKTIVLLSEYQVASRHGAVNRLGRVESITDIVVGNSDDTISMEAAFLMPTRTF